MSFFRNIRTSIKSRGKSSSRDSTPMRNSTASSRPGSVISNATNGRRDSLESRTDSNFNRSDTFILASDQDSTNHSNTSTLEKKSKKSKVFGKFATFTKRKKSPPLANSGGSEHHPSDHATNTYYNWKAEGQSNSDYEPQSDPFQFLYEQQSSLKALQNGEEPTRAELRGNSASAMFDSSTYKKSKMPTQLREQLEQLKTQNSQNTVELHEEGPELESEKYKTVTLNSFRKSFRDKFLQQQHDVPHNPAWFVEVEPPAQKPQDVERTRRESKEKHPGVLVFDNDFYRPDSRSPVRDLNASRRSRSSTRSPVKRNETFRVERPTVKPKELEATTNNRTKEEATPSIRIEFKNSIAPNMPGRLVPVGVAKPMPSADYTTLTTPFTTSLSTTSTQRASRSPLRNWLKPSERASPNKSPVRAHNAGRYQTLVQIRNDTSPFAPNQRSRLSTRIQLKGDSSPSMQKRMNSSYTISSPPPHLSSYELLKKTQKSQSLKPFAMKQPKKHTYFGDSQSQAAGHATKSRTTTTSTRLFPAGTATSPLTSRHGGGAPAGSKQLQQHSAQIRSSVADIYSNRRDRQQHSHSHSQHHHPQHYSQQRSIVPPARRRSRSPAKMTIPWR